MTTLAYHRVYDTTDSCTDPYVCLKKEVFDTIGFFNEAVHTGEIIEWQSKMDSNGFKIKKTDFVSTKRRVHATNFGKTHQKTEFKNYAAILRAKLKGKN